MGYHLRTWRYVKQIEQWVGSSFSGRLSYGSISGSPSPSSSSGSVGPVLLSQRVVVCDDDDDDEEEMASKDIPAAAAAAAMPTNSFPASVEYRVRE